MARSTWRRRSCTNANVSHWTSPPATAGRSSSTRSIDPASIRTSGSRSPKGVRPYPGFVAFEEKDAGVFFGRDQEITQYLDELNLLKAPDRAQALVISGGSGSGKSSLLKAGLIPRLRRQPDWLIVPPFDPSREPVHALFAALRTAAQGVGAEIDLPQKPPQTVDELAELLNDSLRAIEEKANAWLLLPLDQAEVLLAGSQSEGETDASRLLAAVGRLLAGRARKLVAVLTIRTEFMPALERTLPPAGPAPRPLAASADGIVRGHRKAGRAVRHRARRGSYRPHGRGHARRRRRTAPRLHAARAL